MRKKHKLAAGSQRVSLMWKWKDPEHILTILPFLKYLFIYSFFRIYVQP